MLIYLHNEPYSVGDAAANQHQCANDIILMNFFGSDSIVKTVMNKMECFSLVKASD